MAEDKLAGRVVDARSAHNWICASFAVGLLIGAVLVVLGMFAAR